jgi:hypothetical protein
MHKRAEILREAERVICRDRQDTHGKPENTFALIATYWSAFLSEECGTQVEIADADVAVMMALFKVARLQMNPFHQDNVVDGIGYLAIAGELIDNVTGSEEHLNDK